MGMPPLSGAPQNKKVHFASRHYFYVIVKKKGYSENRDDAAKPACDLCLIFIVQLLYILFFILLS